MPKLYGQNDHRRAFEAYFETRNWSETARVAEVAYPTVFRWAQADFACVDSCPYHDWPKLITERESVARAQMDLWESNNVNPIVHGEVVERAIATPAAFPITSGERKRSALAGIYKSDIERIAQLELIYNKLFFDITGIKLAYGVALDPSAALQDLEKTYVKGLRADDLKTAVNALRTILDMIDRHRTRAGLISEDGKDKSEQVEEEAKAAGPLTPEDLRGLLHKLENTSPEQLEVAKAMMESERHTKAAVARAKADGA